MQVTIDIKKICKYLHNGYPHGYEYRYNTYIYPGIFVFLGPFD